jgi:hypothetical protein
VASGLLENYLLPLKRNSLNLSYLEVSWLKCSCLLPAVGR